VCRRVDDLAREVRALPRREQLRLIELVAHELADNNEEQASSAPSIIGGFAHEADLMDQIADDAMVSRERDPLRQSGG
jgi:hypothetical protein